MLHVRLLTMYEGTEQLLNKRLSNFAEIKYRENLKQAAIEFSQQGITSNPYRLSLLDYSKHTLSRILVKS